MKTLGSTWNKPKECSGRLRLARDQNPRNDKKASPCFFFLTSGVGPNRHRWKIPTTPALCSQRTEGGAASPTQLLDNDSTTPAKHSDGPTVIQTTKAHWGGQTFILTRQWQGSPHGPHCAAWGPGWSHSLGRKTRILSPSLERGNYNCPSLLMTLLSTWKTPSELHNNSQKYRSSAQVEAFL